MSNKPDQHAVGEQGPEPHKLTRGQWVAAWEQLLKQLHDEGEDNDV